MKKLIIMAMAMISLLIGSNKAFALVYDMTNLVIAEQDKTAEQFIGSNEQEFIKVNAILKGGLR